MLLDPIPTPLVVNWLDVLLPVQTKIMNTSIMSGQFADGWKCALVNPLLKKHGLDLLCKNYRPISSLWFNMSLSWRKGLYSNRLMDTCFTVIVSYRSQHWNSFVESYEWHHACYGLKMCHASCIVRHDSAAFDTVNHEILINRLQNKVGLQGRFWIGSNHICLIKVSR